MASFVVPKARRPRFDLIIRIHDLNNVPLVSGSSFVKWHIPSSTSAEHRGRTQKCLIRDHRVQYDYEQQIPIRLVVGKDGMLQECNILFEVLQEYSGSGRGERITLGNVKMNLAEYIESSDSQVPSPSTPTADPSEGIVRRYLMQDSKINSTLKIGLYMKQTEGPRDYYAPALKTAPVFGGIAGIISSSEPASTKHGFSSQPNGDSARVEGVDVPSLSASSREIGEMQDMYRRTLAAYWASQPGELKADDAIEDIFAGGDGWGKGGPPRIIRRTSHLGTSPDLNDDESKIDRDRVSDSSRMDNRRRHQMGFGRHKKYNTHARKGPGEVDEFEVRDDLRSWTIGEKAMV